jgi:hypothetical protein
LPFKKELGFIERVSYFGGLLYYITPYQKIFYLLNLVGVAVFGLIPVAYAGGWYLVFWGSATVLNLLAVTALERGTSQPFEGLSNTFITMEAYLRASTAFFSKKSHKFAVTPKSEVDLGGVEALKLLRLPIVLAGITTASILFAWFNFIYYRILDHEGMKPLSLPTTLVITLFGGLEVVVILRTSWKLYHRKQFRELWRFPVRLRAYVNGELSSCIDLHQNGAAFVTTKAAIDEREPFDLMIECRDVNGMVQWANGKGVAKNIRTIAGNSDNIRVGAHIDWEDEKSRTKVIKHCYVVEQYVARQRHWLRTEDRFVVLLPATINGFAGKCVDVSEHGASFIADAKNLNIAKTGEVLEVVVGDDIAGRAEVRSTVDTGDGQIRIGCSILWEESDWIESIDRANRKLEHKHKKHAKILPQGVFN